MHTDSTQRFSYLAIWVWLLSVLFFMYEFFLRALIGSLSHQIIANLQLNAESFALLGSAYYFSHGLMQVPVGILVDRYGVRVLLFLATLVCAVATLLFALSQHFYLALIARLLMGIGSSFAFVGLLMIVVLWFPRKYFALIAGVSQFLGTMGPLLAAGPLISAIQFFNTTWRHALVDVAIFGILLSILLLIFVKNKPASSHDTLIMLQRRRPFSARMRPVFNNPQTWCIALYSALSYISLALLGALWGTEYLQAAGLSQARAATVISFSWLGYAIACPVVGAISDFSQRRRPLLLGCALLGCLATSALLLLPASAPFSYYIILFFSIGAAASGQNIGFATIAEQVDPMMRATALGFNNAMIMTFSALFPLWVSFFIYRASGYGRLHLTLTHFYYGFLWMPVLYGCCIFIVLFFVEETFCKPRKSIIPIVRSLSE